MPTNNNLSSSIGAKEETHEPAAQPEAERARVQQELSERARDLDETRAENARLKSDVAELEAELNALAYSVSHDLRAPLRSVEGFSELLVKEHMAEMPETAQRFLQLVHRNAQEMEELLNGVLAYSRLLRQPLHREVVDIRAIAREAYDELGLGQAGRQVDFTTGDMPVCNADRALLKQVFVILLSNAVKFTRIREVARIEVGCVTSDARRVTGGKEHPTNDVPSLDTRHPASVTFFVRDNGVGFDSQRATKLFSLFRRYHHPDDYPGRGVGLAIAARIVKAHRGRIWAEAAEGRGASFFFTLGDASDAD